jgi:hypothetical protein
MTAKRDEMATKWQNKMAKQNGKKKWQLSALEQQSDILLWLLSFRLYKNFGAAAFILIII